MPRDTSISRDDFIELQNVNFLESISFTSTFKYFSVWLGSLAVLLTASVFVRLPLVEKLPGEIVILDDKKTHTFVRAGIVSEILVQVGDVVETGQPLLTIRSSDLPTAEDLQMRRSQLKARILLNDNEIDRLSLERERLIRENATEVARIQREIKSENNSIILLFESLKSSQEQQTNQGALHVSGLTTVERLERIRAQVRDLETNIQNKKILLEGLSSQIDEKQTSIGLAIELIELSIQKTQIEKSLSSLELESLNLKHEWNVVAQFTGTVSSMQVSLGEFVQLGSSAISVIPNNQSPRIEFYQNASTRLTVLEGREVKVAIDAYPTQNFGLFGASVVEVGRSAKHTVPQLSKLGVLSESSAFKHVAVFQGSNELPQLEDGYSTQVSVLVEDRSVFDWLISPFFIKEY